TPLILVGIGVLVAVLVAMIVAANRVRLAPEFVTEFVLYALIAVDLTMLAALAFVLARNLVKVIVERRRALPFARFRAKLVAVLMAMTVVPAVLVLLVGSELISTNIERWFNAPMDEILVSAYQVASDYYRERQTLVADRAARIAQALAGADLGGRPDVAHLRDALSAEVSAQGLRRIGVYSFEAGAETTALMPVADVSSPSMPATFDRSRIDRLAAQTLGGSSDTLAVDRLGDAGDLLHAAAIVRTPQGHPTGVVVATDYLSGEIAGRSRRMSQAYESYSQMRVLKRP